MKTLAILTLLLGAFAFGQTPTLTNSSMTDLAKKEFVSFASRINSEAIETLPVQNNGRIKPFDSLAREASLFITGSRHPVGLNPIQFYLGLITYEGSGAVEFIEIRNKDLRQQLGFAKSKRYYSLSEINQSGLEKMAKPLIAKDEENHRSLSPLEKDTLEAYHQAIFASEILSANHFFGAVDFSGINGGNSASNPVIEYAKQYLRALQHEPETAGASAHELIIQASEQQVPDLFKGFRSKLGLEVKFSHLRPFLIAGIIYFCLGLMLIFGLVKNVKPKYIITVYAVPLIFHVGGFFTRVYITGFAPVTNMYTTMLWVAFGVTLFSTILYALYRNQTMVGLLLLGSSLVLLLTENFPLILSPDMDPIVAVLRSNYWLTLHVLTVTISYAAFTICMLIGNFALIKTILHPQSEEFYKTYAHYAYRMAQLGVCLISAGIILGGIWADYSWGRFWGWDPKETWALIADMGFIMILHSRYIGWLRNFGILAASTVAYLLVIMAWYGVNFILAAGLHSYGFSSGGATAVATFVSLQFILLVAALIAHKKRLKPAIG